MRCDRLLLDKVGVIGSGGNSGFQALNLALQFGGRKIVGLGFDMSSRSGAHWYGRNNWPYANNPSDDNFKRWIAAFDNAASQMREIGAEFVNASRASALTMFRKATVSEILEEWT